LTVGFDGLTTAFYHVLSSKVISSGCSGTFSLSDLTGTFLSVATGLRTGYFFTAHPGAGAFSSSFTGSSFVFSGFVVFVTVFFSLTASTSGFV